MQLRFFNARQTGIGLALLAILTAHVWGVVSLHPLNFFGWSGDDSIYFSSAKALAQGKGYILPSLPGTPRATLYPIFYPWLLSWVWHWNPSFPSNLSGALTLNLAFGCLFSVMSFVFLRQIQGLDDVIRLVLTVFCAVHPLVLFHTGNVLTDVPFAAIALTSIVLAEKSIRGNAGIVCASLSGIVCGCAVLMRILGAPVAAGIYLAMVLRSGWRKSTAFAASVSPFFAAMLWRSIVSVPQKPPSTSGPCAFAWEHTWLYHTSYPAQFASSLANHTLWQNVGANVRACLLQPGMYFFEAPLVQSNILGLVLVVLLSAVSVRGLIRYVQRGGRHPIFCTLAFYILPVLIWDYPSSDRFLLCFLPLFAAGLALEIQYLVGQIRVSLRQRSDRESRVTAGLFCLVGTILLCALTFSWYHGVEFLRLKSDQRGALLVEKREAYQWLGENSSPEARFIAAEDASAFLYSGRQGLTPTAFLPAGMHRPELLEADLSCLTSTAAPIGANYWIISDDDFGPQWETAIQGARAREAEAEKSLELLFRSHGGHVRIYALGLDLVNLAQ